MLEHRLRMLLGATLGLAAIAVLSVLGSPAGAQQASSGYWTVDANGTVYAFGAAEHLGHPSGRPAIDIEPTPSGGGYYVLQPDGTVWEYGDAARLADPPRPAIGDSWTALTSTSSGQGYWVFSARGCVAAVGDARSDLGSMCGKPLNAPVVGSAVTPGGNGYWMVAKDGGIFSFGDARFHGSTGAMRLNKPVTGMAPAPGGNGYWLVAEDGGIFTFGPGLAFYGSMGGKHLNAPMVGIVTSPTGGGYLMVAKDGGIFAFGDVPFDGSLGAAPPPVPVVSVAALPRRAPARTVAFERLNPESVKIGDVWGYRATVSNGDVSSLAINFRRPNGQPSSDPLVRQPDGTWRVQHNVSGHWMAGTYAVTGMTVDGQNVPVTGAEALGFTVQMTAPEPPPGEPEVVVTRVHPETVAVGDPWQYTAVVQRGDVDSLALDFRRPDGSPDSDPMWQSADGTWRVLSTVTSGWMVGTYALDGVTVNGVPMPLPGAESLGFTVAAPAAP